MFDVCTALVTANQYQRCRRETCQVQGSFAGNRDARRGVLTESQPVGNITMGMEPVAAGDPITPGCRNLRGCW